MILFEESYYKNKLKKFTDKCKIKQNIVIDNVKLEYESIISDKITTYMHNYIGDVYRYPKLIINNEITMYQL